MQLPHKLDLRRIRALEVIHQTELATTIATSKRLEDADRRLSRIEQDIDNAKNVLRGRVDAALHEIWTEKLAASQAEKAREVAECNRLTADLEIARERSTAAAQVHDRCVKFKRDAEFEAFEIRSSQTEEQQRVDAQASAERRTRHTNGGHR